MFRPADFRHLLATTLRETPIAGAAAGLRNLAEGAVSLARAPGLRRTRRGAGIVMYHGVTPEIVDPLVEVAHIPAALFREQIRHLKRHFQVVALGEVVERLAAGKPIPDDWAVITFDDGYRNNLTCAREILREEGDLPMSLFVVTEFVGTRITLVTTLSVMAIAHTRLARIRVPRPDGSWESRSLSSRRARANCFWELLPVLKSLPDVEQQAVAQEFFAQLGNGELAEIRSRFASCDWLDWDEIRQLHADGVDIGGHTRTHVSLRSDLGARRIRDEVFGCYERLEKEVGVAPAHFAYPNGQRQDLSELAAEAAEEAGFRCALTTLRGTVREDADRFALPRLSGCIDSLPRFRIANAGGFRTAEVQRLR
jgi:peptidoglycan/xylan/chitin deacetylase (PgdA/CDA1 family)